MTGPAFSADIVDTTIDMGSIAKAVLRKSVRIILVTLVFCGLAFVAVSFMPRLYESSATLLLDPRENIFTRLNGEQAMTSVVVDETTMSSQIELIKSRDNIMAAINAENLRSAPEFTKPKAGMLSFLKQKEAPSITDEKLISLISERLIVTQERSSRLISVTFRSEDPALAAQVANAIALSHIARIAGNQIADTRDASVWLDQEIRRLRLSVSEAERRVADFRVANDLFMGANNSTLVEQQLSNLSAQISAAAERNSIAGSRALQIRELLDQGQSVAGISEVQASPTVTQLNQERTRLQGERAQRSATLLSNHPTMRAFDAQIADMDNQIALEGRKVASALEAQAKIEADLQLSLQRELETLKVSAGNAAVEGVELAEMEREASAQRELLNAYLIRYSQAVSRTEPNAAFPDIRLVSRAAPADAPSSPKAPLILIAVALASGFLQVGLIIFSELLSGRALKPIYAKSNHINAGFVEKQPDVDPSTERSLNAQRATLTDDTGIADAPKPKADTFLKPSIDYSSEIAAQTFAGTSAQAYIEHITQQFTAKKLKRVFVVSIDAWDDAATFSEQLIVRLIEANLSIAEIDAASKQMGVELGLTDLSAGNADFGQVIHSGVDAFAFVPWGQEPELSVNPDKLTTLIRALSDLYDSVSVVCGQWPQNAAIEQFAGLEGECIILSRGLDKANELAAIAKFQELGFVNSRIITATT